MRSLHHLLSQLGDSELSAAVQAVSREAEAPDVHESGKAPGAYGMDIRERRLLTELASGICKLSAAERDAVDGRRELGDVRQKLTDARLMLRKEKELYSTYSEDNMFLKRALREE